MGRKKDFLGLQDFSCSAGTCPVPGHHKMFCWPYSWAEMDETAGALGKAVLSLFFKDKVNIIISVHDLEPLGSGPQLKEK